MMVKKEIPARLENQTVFIAKNTPYIYSVNISHIIFNFK
jgi:hypothetical protein